MLSFDEIIIIYNPNSTGDSEALAHEFADAAKQLSPSAKTQLIPTKFIAHGEEIAEELAKKPGKILVVSSSGDGGYHEVINGLMAGKRPGSNVTAAVLPAGNANDHSRTMHEKPLVANLTTAKVKDIDLLKITILHSSGKVVRYAHSYAGLGFTPEIGAELNKHDLNPIKEKIIAAKRFSELKPVKILHNDKTEVLDSIVFSNINQMAKVLTFSPDNKPDDGKFEVTIFHHKSKAKLLLKIAKAAVGTVEPHKRLKRYAFTALHSIPMQLDGEVIKLKKDTKVIVTIAPRALKTLV